jgi:hypothetical protein
LAALALGATHVSSNSQIVNLLWRNVVGTQASSSDLQPYINMLEAGLPPGELIRLAADSPFNVNNINLVGLPLTGIEFIPV